MHSKKGTKPLQHAKHEIHPIHLQIIYLFLYNRSSNRNDHFNSVQKSNKLQENNKSKKVRRKTKMKKNVWKKEPCYIRGNQWDIIN